MMRLELKLAVLALLTIGLVGCGGTTENATPEQSAVDQYVQDNAEAVAAQEAIDAAAQSEEEEDD